RPDSSASPGALGRRRDQRQFARWIRVAQLPADSLSGLRPVRRRSTRTHLRFRDLRAGVGARRGSLAGRGEPPAIVSPGRAGARQYPVPHSRPCEPEDYWRFTDAGLEHLLSRAGLDVLWVRTWGNAACVRANFRTWKRRRPWHSLRND